MVLLKKLSNRLKKKIIYYVSKENWENTDNARKIFWQWGFHMIK